MHKKGQKQKLENVSRWQWRRTSYDQVSWKKTSEKNYNDETWGGGGGR